jgi:hypothetical protein
MCCASSSGIPFKSLYVHAKTSLNSFNNCSTFNTLFISNYALVFTMCGFALVPRLNFINYWSLINVHQSICNSYALIFARVSSITTLFGWWLQYIFWYTLSSKATFDSYPLPESFSMCFIFQIPTLKYYSSCLYPWSPHLWFHKLNCFR